VQFYYLIKIRQARFFISFAFSSLLVSLLLSSFTASANTPGTVSYFTASDYSLNHGESVTLRWGKPSGYSGSVTYNIYVTKTGESQFKWRSNLTSTSITRGGSTGIVRTGSQRFDIEACSSSGACGPRKNISITISGPPPRPISFTVSSSSIVQGSSVKLSWTMNHNYHRTTRYNLYETKPGQSRRRIYTNYSGTSLYRTITSAGSNSYMVEPCDSSYGCGPSLSLSVNVQAMPVPGKPSTPSAQYTTVAVNQSQTISWSSVANASSYKLYDTNTVVYSGSVRSVSVSKSSGGVRYYKVAACNLGGCGTLSNARTVNYIASPGAVASFSVDKPQINHGESVVLNWTKPTGFAYPVTYNIYVTKPYEPGYPQEHRFLWRSNLTTTSESRGGDTGINRTGTQVIEIEACHSIGGCGPIKSVNVTVGGPPPLPSTFTVDKANIPAGDSVKLQWSIDQNFQRPVTYNVSVEKPDGSTRYTFARNTSAVYFNRLINMPGKHQFFVQACDSDNLCGDSKSLTVDVEPPPSTSQIIFIHTDLLGSPVLETNEDGNEL